MDKKTRLAYLLRSRQDGALTEQEEGELARLLHQVSDLELTDILREEWQRSQGADAFFEPAQSARMLDNVLSSRKPSRDRGAVRGKLITLHRLAAAAVMLVFIGFGIYMVSTSKQVTDPTLAENSVTNDALPGGNKATLTLSGGNTIVLDSVDNGLLASAAGITINKTRDGQLVYEVAGNPEGESVPFNTLSTPRGGQYQIVLPDGSSVWLNSASTLRFPAVFNGKERSVELRGEAYFEVATNPEMPFKVRFGDTEVEVLGTHFNIMAYDDEVMSEATLLEGSVRVTRDGVANMLEPGQQAVMEHGGGLSIIKKVDVSEVVAWKEGLFQFNDADLQSIMRQAARWYDLDVVYEGEIPQRRFTGRISRNVKASELLSILRYTGVNFKISDEKIVVIQQNNQ